MSSIKTFVNQYPLSTYFIMTFIISWGAILMLVGPNGIPVAPDQAVTLGMAILLGPSITSLLLIGLTSGRTGFRELLSRLFKGRVGLRWYASRAPDCPTIDSSGCSCAVVFLIRVHSKHIHFR